ncbi:MAG: short chain dehydrogenase, partial [Mesorhizobium sp.]
PDRLSETRGYPSEAAIPAAALEPHVTRRLWDVSENLADVDFGAAATTPLHAIPIQEA